MRLADIQRATESKYGLAPGTLGAIATAESAGNPRAMSPAGAQGLYQFMPGTAKDLGIDPFDPEQATEGAGRYMRWLLQQTGGDLEQALAAYNWGIGNLKRKGMVKAPAETRAYVPKVMGLLARQQAPEQPVTSPAGLLAGAPSQQVSAPIDYDAAVAKLYGLLARLGYEA